MQKNIRKNWSTAFSIPYFKTKFIGGLLLLTGLLLLLPVFFGWAEKREGRFLNDWLLNNLKPHNFSILIFLIIWSTVVIIFIEIILNPKLFLAFLWAFICLTLARMLSITLVPLEAPSGLIVLTDPLSNHFYGQSFITKDLFFSGHTSTQLLIYYTLQKKWQKVYALIASFAIGFLVLVQHVHYSIDVIGAFILTWFIYRISLKISRV